MSLSFLFLSEFSESPGRWTITHCGLWLAMRLLALVALLQLAEGAVIGIDLGGEFIKASLVKPRVPLDIVLNPEGRRRSEAVVGFFDGEQAYGGAALNQVRGGLGCSRWRGATGPCVSCELILRLTARWRLCLAWRRCAASSAPEELRVVLEDARGQGPRHG